MSEREGRNIAAEMGEEKIRQLKNLVITHRVLREGVEVIEGEPIFLDEAHAVLVNTIDADLLALEPNPDNRVAIGKTIDQKLSEQDLGGEKGYGSNNYQTALDTIDVLVERHQELGELDLGGIRASIQVRRDTSVKENKTRHSTTSEGDEIATSGKIKRKRIRGPKGIINKALLLAAMAGGGAMIAGGAVEVAEAHAQNVLPAYKSAEGRAETKADLQTAINYLRNQPAHQEPQTNALGMVTNMISVPASGPDTAAALRSLYSVREELPGTGRKIEGRVLSVAATLYDATTRTEAELSPQRRMLRTVLQEIPGLAHSRAAGQYDSDQHTMNKFGMPVIFEGLSVIAASGLVYGIKSKFKPRARRK